MTPLEQLERALLWKAGKQYHILGVVLKGTWFVVPFSHVQNPKYGHQTAVVLGYLPIPFFPGILLSRKPPQTLRNSFFLENGNGWFLKRTMAEKNGESAPRNIRTRTPLFNLNRPFPLVTWGREVQGTNPQSEGSPQTLVAFAHGTYFRLPSLFPGPRLQHIISRILYPTKMVSTKGP